MKNSRSLFLIIFLQSISAYSMDFSIGTFFDIRQITQQVTQQVSERAGEIAVQAITETQPNSSGLRTALVAGAGLVATAYAIKRLKTGNNNQGQDALHEPQEGLTPMPEEADVPHNDDQLLEPVARPVERIVPREVEQQHPLLYTFKASAEADLSALLNNDDPQDRALQGKAIFDEIASDPAVRDVAHHYKELYGSTYKNIIEQRADLDDLFSLVEDIESFIKAITAAPEIPDEVHHELPIKECCICYEEHIELITIPCTHDHQEIICNDCLGLLRVCPICRQPFPREGEIQE